MCRGLCNQNQPIRFIGWFPFSTPSKPPGPAIYGKNSHNRPRSPKNRKAGHFCSWSQSFSYFSCIRTSLPICMSINPTKTNAMGMPTIENRKARNRSTRHPIKNHRSRISTILSSFLRCLPALGGTRSTYFHATDHLPLATHRMPRTPLNQSPQFVRRVCLGRSNRGEDLRGLPVSQCGVDPCEVRIIRAGGAGNAESVGVAHVSFCLLSCIWFPSLILSTIRRRPPQIPALGIRFLHPLRRDLRPRINRGDFPGL